MHKQDTASKAFSESKNSGSVNGKYKNSLHICLYVFRLCKCSNTLMHTSQTYKHYSIRDQRRAGDWS